MLAREKRKKKRGGHGPHQKQTTKNHPKTRGWSESNLRRNRAEIMSHFVIHDHQQGGSPAAPKHKAHFFREKPPRPPAPGGGMAGGGAGPPPATGRRPRGPRSRSAFRSHREPGRFCKDSGHSSGRLLKPAPVSLLPPERGQTGHGGRGGGGGFMGTRERKRASPLAAGASRG